MNRTFRFIIITARKHEHTSQLYFSLIKIGPIIARIVCIKRANNESNKYTYTQSTQTSSGVSGQPIRRKSGIN